MIFFIECVDGPTGLVRSKNRNDLIDATSRNNMSEIL